MLNELIQLSNRLQLSGSEPFIMKKIHWFIELDVNGQLLGISPTVAQWAKSKDGKTVENRGKKYLSPAAFYIKLNEKNKIIAAGGGGKAVAEPGIGNILEIFCKEIKIEKNKVNIQQLKISDEYKHNNLLALHKGFADTYKENMLAKAICEFMKKSKNIPLQDILSEVFNQKEDEKSNSKELKEIAASETAEIKSQESYRKKMKEIATETFSFRVSGKLIFNDSSFKKWWEKKFNEQRDKILSVLPEGVDFFSDEQNSHRNLTTVFPHISGVPNGGPYCPLASFDKKCFQSYGFDSITTPMTLENAEKAGAALNWLLHDDYSHLRIGGNIISVFWAIPQNKTAKPTQPVFVTLLDSNDPLEVKEYLKSPWTHKESEIDPCKFYMAMLSSPGSRITIRSWHTDTLRNAEEKLKSYFKTITLPLYGEETMFSISELAGVTVRKHKKGQPAKPLPNTYVSLFEAALFGFPLPYKLFKAVLIRQAVELAKGAEEKDFKKRLAGRTAVIKLFFKTTKGEDMEQEKKNVETNPGYLCGRLLAMLDKIHYFAHKESGGTNNSPANRVYSVASRTPALIFPRLCNLARYHLNKIGGGLAYNLEFGIPQEKRKDEVGEDWEGLAEICKRLKDTMASGFPRILSLEDQGRFAIGFYFERCKNIPETKSKENNNQNVDQNQKEEL